MHNYYYKRLIIKFNLVLLYKNNKILRILIIYWYYDSINNSNLLIM